jgi:hypothetical protein
MITQAKKFLNSASTSEGHRVIGDIVVPGTPGSVTMSRRPIVEIPTDIMPENPTIEVIKDTLKGMLLASELTESEISALLSMYDEYQADKSYIKDDLFRYGSKLYKVNQVHTSAIQWIPGIGTDALYSAIAPPGVIAEWMQPTGAHNSYHVGDKVSHEGFIWECTHGDASGNNVWEPGVFGWVKIGPV